ncbi:TPA: nucleoside-diphosphate kinase [Candidatus Dependentiae bacterium]|nr:nucleoside-diphosphate kinase [Candidatus Dependentiae bacterium]
MERTFAIIKPDAVKAGHAGDIIRLIELNGFDILRMEKRQITREMAEQFYGIHQSKPFFGELVEYMTSGPVVVMALQRDGAISSWRELMGATDPKKASLGTIRRMFGTHIGSNATHGSDAPETAAFELGLFFPNL